MAVYVSNLTVNTGATFNQTFTLEDSNSNSVLNLTGYTVRAQMRKHPGSSTFTDLNATGTMGLTSAISDLVITSTGTGQAASITLISDNNDTLTENPENAARGILEDLSKGINN